MIRPRKPQSEKPQSPQKETARRRAECAEPVWRKERPSKPFPLRPLRVAAAAVGLIGTALLLFWVSTWLRLPRSVDLVLLGADYGDNLLVPHNSYGWNVLEDFADLSGQTAFQSWGTRLIELAHPPLELHGDSHWKQSFENSEHRAILVHISAHGIVDEDGPCLLMNNVQVPGDSGRLPLASILEQLARLPAQRKKILVLDCTAMTAGWSLGVLANDFARSLESLEPRIEAIPNLIVISASSPDERSWSSGSWRQTVFGHYLLEGLKGGVEDSNADGRIDAWDWYAGVRDATQTWVLANRATRQTPMILPQGTLGYQRARGIDLMPACQDYEPPKLATDPNGEIPEEIVEAWTEHERLARRIPGPALYSPCAWRRYRDLLIRYEELVLAGNHTDASTVHRQMLESQMQVERGIVSGLSSIQNSLGMFETLHGEAVPASVSPKGAKAPSPAKALESLWGAASEGREKEWDKLRSALGDDPSAVQGLRMSLQQLILQRVGEAPAANLQTGSELIRLLDDPLHPRPAESHFLVMLADDLPADKWTDQRRDLLRLALGVRQSAERTAWNKQDNQYACSERVFPWLAPLVEQADRERRMGEDLLFSDARDYPRSEKHLLKAKQLYEEAAQRGAALATAWRVHDQALADLPYYARWVANCRAEIRDDRAERAPWLSELEALCRGTHDLGAALDAGASTEADLAATVRSIAAQTDRVDKSLREFEESLRENWLMMASADSPQALCDMRNALRVPQTDHSLRMKLLARLMQTEARLTAETQPNRSRPSHVTLAEQTERAKWAARVEGRLALAVLGHSDYTALKSSNTLSYDEAIHGLGVFSIEEKWWTTVAKVGHAVGGAWSGIPAAVDDGFLAAGNADRSKGLPLLTKAESFSRLLPGALELTAVKEPADFARRARLKVLFEEQSQRTFENHWYAEDPEAAPYYVVAAEAFLNDANVLCEKWPTSTELRKRVTEKSGLQFSAIAGLDVSSQRRVEIPVEMVAEQKLPVPNGFPVVWVEVGGSQRSPSKTGEPPTGTGNAQPMVSLPALKLLQPSERRTAWLWNASKQSNPLICDIGSPVLEQAEAKPPSEPTVASTKLTLQGRFRGQQITEEVPIRLHLAPDLTRVSYGPPAGASLAVRADEALHRKYGDGNGSVAIVLDCTGSMGPPEGETFSAKTKYAEATQALGRVLARLPRGTTVSVWAFGQAVGQGKTVPAPEKTIERVVDPLQWNPGDPSQLSGLLSKIEYPALEPWNESPIVRAILAAKKDLEGAKGFKTIVVLTDGIDNRVANDKEINPKGEDVSALLRDSFRDSGIELNIVGFRMSAKEESKGWEQFRVVQSLFPPGAFCTVSESDSLAEALDAALRQRLRYWVQTSKEKDVKGTPAGGLEVSRSGENDQWYPGGLNPGSYYLDVNAEKRITQEIALNRGDRLLMRVARDDGGIALEQVAYGEEDLSWKPAQENGRWRATVLQNQRVGNDSLQMLLGLESNGPSNGSVVSVVRPEEAWVDMSPLKSSDAKFLVRWNACWGYPSAAWRIDVPQWPCNERKTLAHSQVKLWWSLGQGTPPDAVLHHPGDFRKLDDLARREVVIGGRKMRLESVGVEEHSVQTGPDRRETRPCLAVRLCYPSDRTIWVNPVGVDATGSEHRFYRDIGHYLGLFWPVSKDSVEDSLQRLELVSLDTFKRTAEQHQNTIAFEDLASPDPNDVGPQPIVTGSDR